MNSQFANPAWKIKWQKRPFNAKANRANDLLELVHSDVCGPMSTQAKGGYEYFITFTGDYSRFGYSNAPSKLSSIKIYSQNSYGIVEQV